MPGIRGPKKNHVGKRLAARWDALGQGAPELMDDVDVARPKPRKAQAKREAPRQRAVVAGLRKHLPAGSKVWAITNHARSRHQVFFLMSQGMIPGWPDLGVLVPGRFVRDWRAPYWLAKIEMKDAGKHTSHTQDDVHAQLRALGVPVLSECCDLEQAVVFLRGQGVEI